MLLILSLTLIILFAVFTTGLFRLKNVISYLLSIYLLIFVNIAFTGHIAHLVTLMNKQWFYLVIEFVCLAGAVILWLKNGKPHLALPFYKKKLKVNLKDFLKNPDLSLLAILVIVSFGVQIYLILTVPPNNNDSFAMHVPRTLYWLQHGNYAPWETNRLAQVFYPVNAQLQMLWSVLFSNSWDMLGFPQFFAQIAATLAIFGIAKMMGFKPVGQIFSGLVFLTYPVIAAQSTTTQNDLVIGGLFGICIYFLYAFLLEKKNLYLVLSGIPIALAVGTKVTAVFLLPGLGILGLIALGYKKMKFKELLIWGASMGVAFLLCGSFIFFQNWETFGNALGAEGAVGEATHAIGSFQEGVSQILISSLKLTYQFIDPSGLPSPFWRWGIQMKARTAEVVFSLFNFDIENPALTVNNHPFTLDRTFLLQEDEAVFGFVGFLALLPMSLVAFIIGLKKKDILLIAPFLFFITFLLSETLFRPGWTPYQGRYFIPLALAATPLLGFFTHSKTLRWIFVPLLTGIAVVIMVNTMLYNPAKPLLDKPLSVLYRSELDPQFREIQTSQTVWGASQIEKMSFQTRALIPICELIDENIPPGATVGYFTHSRNYQFELCLFGEHVPRILVPLYPAESFKNGDLLEDSGAEYLLMFKPPDELLARFESFDLIAVDSKAITYIFEVN